MFKISIFLTHFISPSFHSQAIRVGSHLYISGQLGLVPASGEFKTGEPPVRAQTEQAMRNMGEILKTAGATFDHGWLLAREFF
jgi:enamine deaminase RidA (YjgF/YER057c/UK114 family)